MHSKVHLLQTSSLVWLLQLRIFLQRIEWMYKQHYLLYMIMIIQRYHSKGKDKHMFCINTVIYSLEILHLYKGFTIWSWTSCLVLFLTARRVILILKAMCLAQLDLRVTCLESEHWAENLFDLSQLTCTWGYLSWSHLDCPRSFPWIHPINVWGSLVSCDWFPGSFLDFLESSSWLAWISLSILLLSSILTFTVNLCSCGKHK